jgi:simple sugar transport system permease protein
MARRRPRSASVRLEPRTQTPALWLTAPLAALAFTLAVTCRCGLGWRAGGALYALLPQGGSVRLAWTETLTRATPLILTGLAVLGVVRLAIIGAEGQLYAGALPVAVGGLHGGVGWSVPSWPLSR